MSASIQFLKFTAKSPPRLSKKFSLGADGTLHKESGGQLFEGVAERISVGNLDEFAGVLNGLTSKQALTYGINGHDRARVVSRERLGAAEPGQLPVIARDSRHLHWPDGAGILMLDYDPPDGAEPMARVQLLNLLCRVWPALADAPHMWRPSASSNITNCETGEELRGIRGQRIYVAVLDASDNPRAGQVLIDRLWLAGLGWVKVSASGSLLLRAPVDAIFQPERLDFAGGAECVPPLVQRLAPPVIVNPELDPVDTRVTMRDLTDAERQAVARLQTEAKTAKSDEAAKARAAWMNARLGELAKRNPGVPQARLREVLQRAVEGQALGAEFVLYDASRHAVTVGALLADPKKWNGKYLRDPLEPGYGPSVAWVCIDAKGAFLHSHAHGLGVRYSLLAATVGRRSVTEFLARHSLTDKDVEMIENTRFLVPDLVPQGMVTVYVADPNGGKTVLFTHFACKIAKDVQVYYINADASPAQFKAQQEKARKYGFVILAPDMADAGGVDGLLHDLREIANSDSDMSGLVFIVDTLKKFADLLDKGDLKGFLNLLRKLNAKGATFCLLAHANKYRDADGNLIFEGVGDLRADVDNLIYLYSSLAAPGVREVTTKPDKTRATFGPRSFRINFGDSGIAVDELDELLPPLTDDLRTMLKAATEGIAAGQYQQGDLVKYCVEATMLGINSVRSQLLKLCTMDAAPLKRRGRNGYGYRFSLTNAGRGDDDEPNF